MNTIETKEFKFKSVDNEGAEILDVISSADKFNEWMYETIKPFCKGKVLEIGSGIGNISTFFLRDNFEIMLTDIRDVYCDKLNNLFSENKNLLGIKNVDLIDPEFDIKHKDLLNSFDTVFALNVVEHIQDDTLAISNCKKLLTNNGNLIILVPAFQTLYNSFDKSLEHYRRYNKESLNKLFQQNNIKIIHDQYFNLMGILGWFISGKVQKNTTFPQGQMDLYNTLVPVFKIIDKVILNQAGLSVITVGNVQTLK
ncbi:MAG TPA: class I SAM-dependent methyltransferase [Ignavibacteria bacterium]|mgnify:CR=1 FL=1|nr:class I SAM-dependent methyltransferase [Ignavibacteria bacterium]